MPSNKPQHWWDDVGDDVVTRMQNDEDWLYNAVLGGERAPGSADLSEAEKLDYYRRHFFNPDGTPNDDERAKIINRVGLQRFGEIFAEVTSNKSAPFVVSGNKLDGEDGLYGE